VGGLALLVILRKAQMRLQLSRANHRSLRDHSRCPRRFQRSLPFYEYGEAEFFSADGATRGSCFEPPVSASCTWQALFAQRYAKTAASPLTFKVACRTCQFTFALSVVPFQFSSFVRQHFKLGAGAAVLLGTHRHDLDGNQLYDLTGLVRCNVFGYDFYRSAWREAPSASKTWAGPRCLASGGCLQCRAAERDLRTST